MTLPDVALGDGHVAAHNLERATINQILSSYGGQLTLEILQDAVNDMIVQGANITKTYDDVAGTITISSTGGSGGATDVEVVRDTIGAALVSGAGIGIVVNDAGDTITISNTAPSMPAIVAGSAGKNPEVNAGETAYSLGVRKSPAAYPISGTTAYAPQGLTKWYNPLEPSYGLSKDQMSGWRLGMGKARSGKGLANLYMLGDSGAAGFFGKNTAKPNDPANAWPNVMKDSLLGSGLPWGGTGFVSPSQNLVATDAGDPVDPRFSFGNVANWDCHKYGLYATTSTNGETATVTAEQEGGTDAWIVVDNAKPAMNYTVRNSAGTIIAGPTSTAPTGASSLKMIHVTGVDIRSITQTVTAAGPPPSFIYPMCISKSSGLMVHNLSFVAAIGAGASGWENTGAVYNGANKIAQLCAASLAPDLLMVQLGGNDEFNAYSYSTITTGIANLFGQFTAPSKIFVFHGQASTWTDAYMATSGQTYWQMCEDNNLGMIDQHAISGGYTKMLNAGIMEDTTGGQVHPNQVLAYMMGPIVARLLGAVPSLETLQDNLARSIIPGANVSVTYDDTSGLITISSSGGGGGGSGFTSAPAWAASSVYAAGAFVRLPTGGIAYRTTAGTSRATFDATERDLWTFIPGGHYEKLSTTGAGSWKTPVGIVQCRFRLKGSGGSGGGGASAATAIAQSGGGGGGACDPLDFETPVTPGSSYTTSVAVGKSGGTGGAAGGNQGTVGVSGDDTTISIGGVTFTSKGGGGGSRSAASANTAANGGMYGVPGGTVANGSFYPGGGGVSGAAATGSVPLAGVVGGGGGVSSTTTLGGNGGSARTAPGQMVAAASGNTATTSGGAGTSATEYGCGGGGGGGGTGTTGVGGSGGDSAQGVIEAWF